MESLAHPHITLILAIWATIGPLVGIVAGHYLTRSWQREQWLLDQRKNEIRELIAALDDSLLSETSVGRNTGELNPQEHRDKAYKTRDFYKVCRTRIFTAQEVRQLDLEKEWKKALAKYQQKPDDDMLRAACESLRDALVKAALYVPKA
jgi:hypothetical protein